MIPHIMFQMFQLFFGCSNVVLPFPTTKKHDFGAPRCGDRLTMLDMFEGEGAKRAPGDLWATQISDENDKILKSWLVNVGVTWL